MSSDSDLQARAEEIAAFVERRLGEAFGNPHPLYWPSPLAVRPRWYEPKKRATEKRINDALASAGIPPVDQAFRERWHTEWSFGQGVNEDAGGYFWRCWAVACGLGVPAPISYTDSLGHLVAKAIKDPSHEQ